MATPKQLQLYVNVYKSLFGKFKKFGVIIQGMNRQGKDCIVYIVYIWHKHQLDLLSGINHQWQYIS